MANVENCSGDDGGPDPVASARDMAGDAGQTLKRDAAELAETGKRAAMDQVRKKQSLAAELAEDLAAALQRAGETLSQRDREPAAGIVRKSAEAMSGLSRSFAEKEPGELADTVRQFGRENPVAFAAGSALAGFAIGRFLRAAIEPEFESSEAGAAEMPPVAAASSPASVAGIDPYAAAAAFGGPASLPGETTP